VSQILVVSVGLDGARLLVDLAREFPRLVQDPTIHRLHLDLNRETIAFLRAQESPPACFNLTEGLDLRYLASVGAGKRADVSSEALELPSSELPTDSSLLKTILDYAWQQGLAEALLDPMKAGLLSHDQVVLMLGSTKNDAVRTLFVDLETRLRGQSKEFFEASMAGYFQINIDGQEPKSSSTTRAREIAALLVGEEFLLTESQKILSGPEWKPLHVPDAKAESGGLLGIGRLLNSGLLRQALWVMESLPWPELAAELQRRLEETSSPAPLDDQQERQVWLLAAAEVGKIAAIADSANLLALASDDGAYLVRLCAAGQTRRGLELLLRKSQPSATEIQVILTGFRREYSEARLKQAAIHLESFLEEAGKDRQVVVPDRFRGLLPSKFLGTVRFSARLQDEALTYSWM